MFGCYRYALAIMVVVSHLWPTYFPQVGGYAVFGFYMLSGYLMTFVLNRVYGFSGNGLSRFMMNRALRIYPPYLAVMLLSLFVVLVIPAEGKSVNPFLQLPTGAPAWLSNVFIFGLTYKSETRLIPSAWSLYVELSFYLGMAVLLARWRVVSVIWFGLSLCYTLYMLGAHYPPDQRYYTLQASSLPFSTGSVICFIGEYLRGISRWHVIPATLLFFLNGFTASFIWRDAYLEGFYASLFFSAYLLIVLSSLDRQGMPDWLVRSDRALGDMSYPIFLCHFHVAALVIWLMFDGTRPPGSALFVSSFIFINCTAFIINVAIEHKVNRLRSVLRTSVTSIRNFRLVPGG